MKMRILVILLAVILVLLVAVAFVITNYQFINGSFYAKDLESLDLSGKPLKDLDGLSGMSQLQRLDLRNTQITPEEYEAVQAQLPDCEILWLLPFQGKYLPLDTTALTLTSLKTEEIPLLAYLPQLKTVDATACPDHDALLALQKAYPNCSVRYSVPLDGQKWPENTTVMDLSAAAPEALDQALSYLGAVTQVTIQHPIEDAPAMLALKENYPDIAFTYSFRLLDKTVSTKDTFLDLSGVSLKDTAALEAALPHFDKLEKVDMCGCGLSDDAMSALNKAHPDTLFVWEVYFGENAVRTDITYFMPYQLHYKITDKDADTLKHLTQLLCLDLGHMEISRSDYLQYMTKMKYLLLGQTPITDISGCANMPDLIYAELFMTEIKDFSPLTACKKLEDLNVCFTKPTDPSVFCQMPQLKSLWFRGNYDKAVYNQLKQGLPNTNIAFDPGTATEGGWRKLQNYYDMRDLLGMPYMEAS